MAPKNNEGCSRLSSSSSNKKAVVNKGAWTVEEDRKLAEYIEIHGAKKWKAVAFKAGLNRCGKSCRLRWLNYLRPNIKRGNISDAEEDLILRLHKLLGNRWSLIAGRLPGRTDNEIKNYWNSHLSKRANQKDKQMRIPRPPPPRSLSLSKDRGFPPADKIIGGGCGDDINAAMNNTDSEITFDVDEFFDFSTEGTYGLDWVNKFLELDEDLS